MQAKINYNKSIKDKEKKILEYYKSKSKIESNQIPKFKKRTKKHIPTTHIQETEQKINELTKSINSTKSTKLTKTAQLPIHEPTKPKIVEMD
jgi:hypothetical protein